MVENLKPWIDIATLIKIDATWKIKGKVKRETRYYISDESFDNVAYYNSLLRGHWAIENKLHWHLEVTFMADQCRTRIGNAHENLSTLRKFAVRIFSNTNK